MKVICAGPHRSGSTWLYNATRLILDPAYACFHRHYDPENPAENHVIKIHGYKKIESDFILMSSRNWIDVTTSAVRMGITKISEIEEFVEREFLKNFLPWQSVADLVVDYEEMISDKPGQIKRIAEKLGVDVNPVQIHQKVESLVPPTSGRDILTHLHANHISNGEYKLDPLVQERIVTIVASLRR